MGLQIIRRLMRRNKFAAVVLSLVLITGAIIGCSKDPEDVDEQSLKVDEHSSVVESVIAEIDAYESTEESTEATTTTVEETTEADTVAGTEATPATTADSVDVIEEIIYDGSDYESFRAECIAAGYDVMTLEEAGMEQDLTIRDGFIDAFVADASDEEHLEAVYAFQYDTAEHARFLYDFFLDFETYEVVTSDDLELSYNETANSYNGVYYNEELAIVVVVIYISV